MKIEAYDLDSLRKLVRALQEENRSLRSILRRKEIPAPESDVFDEYDRKSDEFDPDQGARIQSRFITDEDARNFYSYFWGRTDVYAERGNKGGYFPACSNKWKWGVCPLKHGEKIQCSNCQSHAWKPIDKEIVKRHLYSINSKDVIGIYPLLPNGTCRLLAFDFDNHEKGAEKSDYANTDGSWMDEVDALRLVCMQNGIDHLVERSRSGRGAHLWIFFSQPVPASMARQFGRMVYMLTRCT